MPASATQGGHQNSCYLRIGPRHDNVVYNVGTSTGHSFPQVKKSLSRNSHCAKPLRRKSHFTVFNLFLALALCLPLSYGGWGGEEKGENVYFAWSKTAENTNLIKIWELLYPPPSPIRAKFRVPQCTMVYFSSPNFRLGRHYSIAPATRKTTAVPRCFQGAP